MHHHFIQLFKRLKNTLRLKMNTLYFPTLIDWLIDWLIDVLRRVQAYKDDVTIVIVIYVGGPRYVHGSRGSTGHRSPGQPVQRVRPELHHHGRRGEQHGGGPAGPVHGVHLPVRPPKGKPSYQQDLLFMIGWILKIIWKYSNSNFRNVTFLLHKFKLSIHS